MSNDEDKRPEKDETLDELLDLDDSDKGEKVRILDPKIKEIKKVEEIEDAGEDEEDFEEDFSREILKGHAHGFNVHNPDLTLHSRMSASSGGFSSLEEDVADAPIEETGEGTDNFYDTIGADAYGAGGGNLYNSGEDVYSAGGGDLYHSGSIVEEGQIGEIRTTERRSHEERGTVRNVAGDYQTKTGGKKKSDRSIGY